MLHSIAAITISDIVRIGSFAALVTITSICLLCSCGLSKPAMKDVNRKKGKENAKSKTQSNPIKLNGDVQGLTKTNPTEFSKLNLHDPLDLHIDLFDTLEFFCDCCPLEMNGYTTALNHMSDFQHYNVSVNYQSHNEPIKCQSCGDIDLTHLHVIIYQINKLRLCCTSCLEFTGLDDLIHSLSSKDTLLKYVDNMYRLHSMKCIICNSSAQLFVDKEDRTPYCEACASSEGLKLTDLMNSQNVDFLSFLFKDDHYKEFKNIISMEIHGTRKEETVKKEKFKNSNGVQQLPTPSENSVPSPHPVNSKRSKMNKKKEAKNDELTTNGLIGNTPPPENLADSPTTESTRSQKKKNQKKPKKLKKQIVVEPTESMDSIDPVSTANLMESDKTSAGEAKKPKKKKNKKSEKNGECELQPSKASSELTVVDGESKKSKNKNKKKVKNAVLVGITAPKSENTKKNEEDMQSTLPSAVSKNSKKSKKNRKVAESSILANNTKGPRKLASPAPELTGAKKALLDGLTAEEMKVEDKFSKLKRIIKNTLPQDKKTKFSDMNEYYGFLVYSLLLEELFTLDFCTDVDLEWEDNEHCVMSGSTKTWFDTFVNEDIHHLKKHPFVRDQTIFIVRKENATLNWETRPEFWVARIAKSTLDKVDRKGRKVNMKRRPKHATAKKSNQSSSFNLELYAWNESKFPIKERGSNFAFLPASTVLTRIINSMNQIENKDFINLILGKNVIKRINFNNVIQKSFNKLNDSQSKALQSAFNNTVTILQGPPGSGKTSTIYEIILQLLENLHYYPILVVAASNLAVDNIAEKLMPHYKDNILRITSISKEKEYQMDHPLGPICLHNKISNILPQNIHDIERRLKRDSSSISSAEFSKYLDACSLYGSQFVSQANIIFATTAGIAGPHLKRVKNMPVIIMDEATQSSEPSTLIPLGAKGCKKVILVGDTAQLSVFTRVKSLETSLFERVLENGTYSDPYMLDTQYRMHPDISSFSRRKFYDSKLKDGISAEDRKKSNINYPVYFYNHAGIGAKEAKQFSMSGEEYGFSWVNHKEVSYVERFVEKLLVDKQVSPKSIGIMTGYAAQRELIVKALENNMIINPNKQKTNKFVDKEDLSEKKNVTVCNVNGIIVATVDAFQGREMDFVILSCVRSNDSNTIGFMSDPRRMNVAFTRAKYSFILIGNAQTLSSSTLWREYINELTEKNYVKKTLLEY